MYPIAPILTSGLDDATTSNDPMSIGSSFVNEEISIDPQKSTSSSENLSTFSSKRRKRSSDDGDDSDDNDDGDDAMITMMGMGMITMMGMIAIMGMMGMIMAKKPTFLKITLHEL
ncbi:unnamed protein product [Rhizophagus irregularis]|nr:unnamed protein product [Rhizophagus irregularis]